MAESQSCYHADSRNRHKAACRFSHSGHSPHFIVEFSLLLVSFCETSSLTYCFMAPPMNAIASGQTVPTTPPARYYVIVWGSDADRRGKPLNQNRWVGSACRAETHYARERIRPSSSASCGPNICLLRMGLAPPPVRGLLRPVSANIHAAPSSRATSRVIGEEERAAGALARLHIRKILLANKVRKRLADRQQKRRGRWPPARRLKLKGPPAVMPESDTLEKIILLKQAI